jgi:hypothetical protein
MRRRFIVAIVAAGLTGLLLVQTDAVARGRGGHGWGGMHASPAGSHGGHFNAFRARGFTWARQGGANGGKKDMHGGDPRHSGQHDGRDHGARGHTAHSDGGHRAFGDGHATSHPDGSWRRAPGFGDHGHPSPNAQGQWRVESEFR